jgi:hypothetical protein
MNQSITCRNDKQISRANSDQLAVADWGGMCRRALRPSPGSVN